MNIKKTILSWLGAPYCPKCKLKNIKSLLTTQYKSKSILYRNHKCLNCNSIFQVTNIITVWIKSFLTIVFLYTILFYLNFLFIDPFDEPADNGSTFVIIFPVLIISLMILNKLFGVFNLKVKEVNKEEVSRKKGYLLAFSILLMIALFSFLTDLLNLTFYSKMTIQFDSSIAKNNCWYQHGLVSYKKSGQTIWKKLENCQTWFNYPNLHKSVCIVLHSRYRKGARELKLQFKCLDNKTKFIHVTKRMKKIEHFTFSAEDLLPR